MELDILRKFFELDGSLRDIYVPNTGEQEWDALLTYLHNSDWSLEFLIGRAPHAAPKSWAEVRALSAEESPVLHLRHNGILVNTFFRDVTEIELDLDPREFQSDEQLLEVHDFMRTVGRLLSRPIFLTFEGAHERPSFRYDPATDDMEYLHG